MSLDIPENFPDPAVLHAYLYPNVDANSQEFIWGVPNLDRIRSFLEDRVGQPPHKTDEVLVPVIREMVNILFLRILISF
jgi:DNA excision repair protein ERCC-5